MYNRGANLYVVQNKGLMNIPKKYQPKGFEIFYEDKDLIVGNKAAGALCVSALWNRDNTIHQALNQYVRKGQVKSHKCVYVVHRLDQDTTGVLVYAKSPQAQAFLKENWVNTVKYYYAIVQGNIPKKSGTFSSYLEEDEDYVVRSTENHKKGKFARTDYDVVKENAKFSLLKVNLLTGKKNQIRVHLAEAGHPIVGDDKYGQKSARHKNLMLHAYFIAFLHPFNRRPVEFKAPVPDHFKDMFNYAY